jgi:hypothetical protein
MSTIRSFVSVLVCLVVTSASVMAQASDYAIKKNFEERYKLLQERVDSSRTIAQLDTLKQQIDSLEAEFSPRAAFLDKVLYPESFAERINSLRGRHILTYDRVYLLQTQGVRISELESRIALMQTRIDSLSSQKDQLFAQLQEARRNVQNLRDAVRRLTANLSLKDKLIFALVDSIFLPYDKNLNQVSEMQREAIARKLERANVVTRVYEFAADNVKFLEVTQLQAKDFAELVDQYQQFKGKWDGLGDKMNAVAASGNEVISTAGAPSPGHGGTAVKASTTPPRAQVDSVVAEWRKKLQAAFWASLQKEFTDKQLTILPFTDAAGFSASVRAYVEAVKQSGQDPKVFVDEVWKDRIDREWREALTKESMLGKTEYAALDKMVGELSREKFDIKFIFYIILVVAVVVAVWWFFFRKPQPKAPEQGQAS